MGGGECGFNGCCHSSSVSQQSSPVPRALSFSVRRECSWDPPPETTLQSSSWSSWATPGRAGDDDPATVTTPTSQPAATRTTATSAEVAVAADQRSADVAPREGVSLGHGGAANGGRDGGSSVAIVPSADEGGRGASVVASAAGDADSSGTRASGGQRSTAIQVWSLPERMHSNAIVLVRYESNIHNPPPRRDIS